MSSTSEISIKQFDYLPAGFLDSHARDLHQILPGPALIHLQGRLERPLFVSVLLHGNEITGLETVQAILRKYQDKELPRSLSIFTGNIQAARQGVRRLDQQPDFNRIWPGTEHEPCSETRMTQQVVDEMVRRKIFASVDIHNNTGLNPHYACINRLDNRFFNLATLFSRLVVYFLRPKGVQSAAFAAYCPAVTLECGKPGQQYGVEHACEFLDACLHLSEHSDNEINPGDIDLFHTVAQVNILDHLDFSFDGSGADLQLDAKLDHMNFTEIPAGRIWGQQLSEHKQLPLIAKNEAGEDVTSDFFSIINHDLISIKSVMPSMLTLDEKIVRQDCLCYLMERMTL